MAEGAPEARADHVAVWTGGEMLVWGGVTMDPSSDGFWSRPRKHADGAAYRPELDTWRTLPVVGAAPRSAALGFWTGHNMIVWGGIGPDSPKRSLVETFGGLLPEDLLYDCLAFDPVEDRWRRLASSSLRLETPFGASRPPVQATWTGLNLIVWGAGDDDPRMERPGVGLRFTP